MTIEELKAACETAGLEVSDLYQGEHTGSFYFFYDGLTIFLYQHEVVAKSVVAELLTAKVRELPETDDRVQGFCSALDGDTSVIGWALRSRVATAEQRIRAAMRVLK